MLEEWLSLALALYGVHIASSGPPTTAQPTLKIAVSSPQQEIFVHDERHKLDANLLLLL